MTLIDTEPLRARAGAFLDYLDDWLDDLLPMPLESLIAEAGGPQHVGIFCVDVINGFCYEGPLASGRVAGIVPPIVELFQNAYASGVENFVLTHDAHDPAALEFMDYPPHCIRGTSESDIVPELLALPFASRFHLIPKNSISSSATPNSTRGWTRTRTSRTALSSATAPTSAPIKWRCISRCAPTPPTRPIP